ncbi:TonB-dependent receptor plug domain-containing protein [Aliikangiella coralliicola]|uniref:TonB-dependent receptor n=1 Tax=Aliikangiella coralliicola TaxID=2592383 RepID=A0A545UCJ9_9GAMM|nr:TonB-dependent receptor [Aliikangiella coralliicola]TQV87153.1 TonB-dependent receptor [Aliikangiella coralliicola]
MALVIILGLGEAGAVENGEDYEDDSNNQNALFDLSLEDLLEMRVIVSSKQSQLIQKAPGVVRVFTRNDIEKFGYLTLRDLLGNVPGVQLDEARNGHTLIFMRGVQSRYNSKILLLIDGVPIRDPYYGQFLIDEQIPLQNVERVEIISGPGSVLYGANGFAGVISVITRSDSNEVQAYIGNDNTIGLSVNAAKNNFSGFVDYYDTKGWQPSRNRDGSTFDHDQRANNEQLFLKYQDDNWTAILNLQNYQHPWTYRDQNSNQFGNRNPDYFSLKYRKQIMDSTKIDIHGYYSDYRFIRESFRFDNLGNTTLRTEEDFKILLNGLETNLSWQKGQHIINLGVSYQADFTENASLNNLLTNTRTLNLARDSVHRSDIGLYFQDIWELTDELILTYGVRKDVLSDFDNELNYRVALTGDFENWYGKAMVGTAYRIPSYREYLDVRSFNFDLQPEHMTTFELQIGRKFDRGDANLTYFISDYQDFIKDLLVCTIQNGEEDFLDDCVTPNPERPVNDPDDRVVDDEYAINADKRRLSGLEFSSRFIPSEQLSLNLNLTYLFDFTEEIGRVDSDLFLGEAIDTGEVDLVYLSDFSVSIAASYQLDETAFGINLSYFSKRDVPPDYQTGVPVEIRNINNADEWYKLDLYLSTELSTNAKFYLKSTNLLDAEIFSQPFGGDLDYDNQWEGRNIRLGVVYQF